MTKLVENLKNKYPKTYLYSLICLAPLGFFIAIEQLIILPKFQTYTLGNYKIIDIEPILVLVILFFFIALFAIPIIFFIEMYKNNYIDKKQLLKSRRRARYTYAFAKEKDLKSIVELGRKMVGENHIDLKTLEERYAINNKIVTCILDPMKVQDTLIGYFILYPLKKNACHEIQQQLIINGRGIKTDQLCNKFSDAYGLYVAMVGGEGVNGEGFVIKELLRRISPLLGSNKLKMIFAKGATTKGKSAVNTFNFLKYPEPSEISVRYINDEFFEDNRIKRHLSFD